MEEFQTQNDIVLFVQAPAHKNHKAWKKRIFYLFAHSKLQKQPNRILRFKLSLHLFSNTSIISKREAKQASYGWYYDYDDDDDEDGMYFLLYTRVKLSQSWSSSLPHLDRHLPSPKWTDPESKLYRHTPHLCYQKG